jgi:hypothetical protein
MSHCFDSPNAAGCVAEVAGADALAREHLALLGQYGAVQARCSGLIEAQRAEIVALRAREMRLHAGLVIRDSALAWAREDHALWQARVPGLPRRAALAERVEALMARVQALMRERLRWQARVPASAAAPVSAIAQAGPSDYAALEESLGAADLVICQTGCLSHGAYWRVQDHCRRTGKPCVLVGNDGDLRIVRIHEHGIDVPAPAQEAGAAWGKKEQA